MVNFNSKICIPKLAYSKLAQTLILLFALIRAAWGLRLCRKRRLLCVGRAQGDAGSYHGGRSARRDRGWRDGGDFHGVERIVRFAHAQGTGQFGAALHDPCVTDFRKFRSSAALAQFVKASWRVQIRLLKLRSSAALAHFVTTV